jgi:hypothetical protein
MAKGKKTFIFYSDWINMINEMPNEDAGDLLKHILSYVNDENPTTDNILVKMAFGHIKPMLKADLDKWDKQLEKYSEMGKKSAVKRALNKTQPTLTYVKPTSTVNDNVNDNIINNKEFKNQILKDSSYIEITAMQTKSNVDTVKKYLTDFDNHLIRTSEQKNTLKDYKTHFTNWFNRQDIKKVVNNNPNPYESIL